MTSLFHGSLVCVLGHICTIGWRDVALLWDFRNFTHCCQSGSILKNRQVGPSQKNLSFSLFSPLKIKEDIPHWRTLKKV